MQRASFSSRLCLFAAAAGFAALPLHGISYTPVADHDLADQSPLIVEARVIDAEVRDSARGLVTAYTVEALDAVKGQAPGGVFEVQVAGGIHADGRGTIIWGLPTFAPGEETLLFLRPDGDAYRIAHMIQGVFRAADAAGERYWQRRSAAGEHPVARKGLPDSSPLAVAAERYATPRHAERFTAWLADRARGVTREADYFGIGVEPVARQPLAKFTLISLTPRLRWFAFDDGEAVQWSRHSGGQEGLADRGVAAFRRARRAWNNEPNTPIRLQPTADSSSTTGFGSSDGRNTILFRDWNDDIDADYSCNSGGTLAVAGPSFILGGGTRRTWKGDPHGVIVEAAIVVNDGVECFAQREPLGIEQVYTHELGHTLGLGHACGDDNSPRCAPNPSLDAALMRALLRGPFVGAVLSPDDIAAARWLYDADFFDQMPGQTGGSCPLNPGNGRFCTDCGPCTAGQGDCDRDSECAAGLVCTDNIGAQFGFAPGVDVCIEDGNTTPPPPDGCPVPLGSGRFCTDCGPCENGQGDCDSDDECAAGFECVDNVGATFGYAPAVDVCLPVPGECPTTNGRGDFCSLCGPCGSGEGDCDSDAECAAGLVCVDDVGAVFGFGERVDVCL